MEAAPPDDRGEKPPRLREVLVLEDCNRHLHDVGHRAGGILLAARIHHGGGPVPCDIVESYRLLRRVVEGSDAALRAAREAEALLTGPSARP